jgi:thioredoxin 1
MKPFKSLVSRAAFIAVLSALLVSTPLAFGQAAGKGTPAPAKPEAAKAKSAPAPKASLYFFINPAGRPCQMQDQILSESRAQWEPLATLRYARTDVPADRELFYKFGVRALPSLILVGTDGKELKRFSPGIQPAETVVSGVRAGTGR